MYGEENNMNTKIEGLLKGEGGNYILPFFWQHGEDEETLREYMHVIHDSNIGAVCIESRPHPDFAGPGWWHDMDIILDEAEKLSMKVWILDDSHFPTGYANGAVDAYPENLGRKSIVHTRISLKEGERRVLSGDALWKAPERILTEDEKAVGDKNPRIFHDDRLLAVYAVKTDGTTENLMDEIHDGKLSIVADADEEIYLVHVSGNYGYHTHYINMLSQPSVRILIDTVYEAHWNHYKDKFGTVIAGFFSDEPELGNGHLYEQTAYIGNPDMDYPWSVETEKVLREKLGAHFADSLHLLFEDGDPEETAYVRFTYMDVITRLVRKDFSFQIGNWCREHGVKYIGHMIEDNDASCKTGSSLGHYFRGLAGQDWAGVDDIGGQVYPQGEDDSFNDHMFRVRDGEFYHYMLGALASSAAAIEPLKCGNSMCEIFGAYGWSEGVRLEKYLADHFMVRGVNHFVPHAFSAKAFPDPDCPPHFYAHGHNPQYRHFGCLMKYMNRVLELTNGCCHISQTAVLYDADSAWAGKCAHSHESGRVLIDRQLDVDYIPQDVFDERENYQTRIEDGSLRVNTQEYRTVVIPQSQYIRKALAAAIPEMDRAGATVIFENSWPEGIEDTMDAEEERTLIEGVKNHSKAVPLHALPEEVRKAGAEEISLEPADDRIRYMHFEEPDGSAVYMFVNEGTSAWSGEVHFAQAETRSGYYYNAWENTLHPADFDGAALKLSVTPYKSVLFILDKDGAATELLTPAIEDEMRETVEVDVSPQWERSLSPAASYPDFREKKTVLLPDHLAEEQPLWSGIARYENTFKGRRGEKVYLELTDASEGVEVFVNSESLGIQIAAPFLYDLSDQIRDGENHIAIEVATTLEREMSVHPNPLDFFLGKKGPESESGITGSIKILRKA